MELKGDVFSSGSVFDAILNKSSLGGGAQRRGFHPRRREHARLVLELAEGIGLKRGTMRNK